MADSFESRPVAQSLNLANNCFVHKESIERYRDAVYEAACDALKKAPNLPSTLELQDYLLEEYSAEQYLNEHFGLYTYITPEDHEAAADIAIRHAMESGQEAIDLLDMSQTSRSDKFMAGLLRRRAAEHHIEVRVSDRFKTNPVSIQLDDASHTGLDKEMPFCYYREHRPKIYFGGVTQRAYARLRSINQQEDYRWLLENPDHIDDHPRVEVFSARRIPCVGTTFSPQAQFVFAMLNPNIRDMLVDPTYRTPFEEIRKSPRFYVSACVTAYKLPDDPSFPALFKRYRGVALFNQNLGPMYPFIQNQ